MNLRRSLQIQLAACAALALTAAGVPAQQFQQPGVAATGNWPAGIVTADVNGDGRADLIVTDFGATATASTTRVLLNNGDGTFRAGPVLATAGTAIAAADFDRDGHIDLEWVWSVEGLGKVFFAQGNGDGTFQAPVELGTFAQIGTKLPQLSYVMAAKMHDSGYLDLLVEDVANSAIFELTADSSGTLVRLAGTQLPDGAGPMAAADLNGDGHTDLVIQSLSGGTVDVLFGSADGLLQPAARVAGAANVQSFLLQDVDGDAHPDLLVQTAAGAIQMLHGNPDGTFTSGSTVAGASGQLIALTDQHILYTATAAGMAASSLDSRLAATPLGVYNAGPGRTSFAAADLNGDGTQDLAVDSPEGVALLFANPDGTLRSSRAFSVGEPVLSDVLGGFSGSGHLDAVAGMRSNKIETLIGHGDGTFTALAAPTTDPAVDAALPSPLAAADFNGDGRLDLVLTDTTYPASGSTPGVSIRYGHGDGTFAPAVAIPDSLTGRSIAGAFGANGAVGLANAGAGGQRVLLVQQDGSFSTNFVASSASASGLQAAGDLNGDGLADLVSLDGSAPNVSLNIYLNTGAGSFALAGNLPGSLPVPDSLAGLTPSAVAVADLDGDGKGDVIALYDDPGADHAHPASAVNNRLAIWYGRGDGSFETPVFLSLTRNFNQLAVADLDGDGRPDLALSDGYLVATLRNLGARAFDAERHWIAGMGITAISTGDVNEDGATDLMLANAGVGGGLAANAGSQGGGLTVLLNHLDTRKVTGTLTAPTSTAYGQAFNIVATVAGVAGANGGPLPTGTITFFVDDAAIGTATLTGGADSRTATASIVAPATMTVGSHHLTAHYSGDANYAAAELGGAHNVSGIASSIVLTMTTPTTLSFGELVDGYATVTAADQGPDTSPVSGTITFYDGKRSLCVVSAAKKQSCPAGATTGFAAGPHTMTAVYSGDSTHAQATSNAVNVLVTADATTASLTASASAAQTGQSVVFAATLHGSHAVPSGTVSFVDGSTVIGTATLDASGVATLAIASLPAGQHAVSAVYGETQNFSASSSPAVGVTVRESATLIQTAAMLSSSANPSSPGQSLTFTANVVTVGPSLRTPTGTVTFLDGSNVLGQAALDANGVATWTVSGLSAGTHNITASYAGDATSAASVSPGFTQAVNVAAPAAQAHFLILASNVSVYTGSQTSVPVKVSPLNGFHQPVQLGCANLPSEATCTFAQATVPAGGGTVVLRLNTVAPHACSAGTPYFTAANSMSLGGPAFAGLLLLLVPRRHRALKGLLLALVAITGMAAITGCGACTDLGTKPGTYKITITGQSTGATQATATQQIVVTVQD